MMNKFKAIGINVGILFLTSMVTFFLCTLLLPKAQSLMDMTDKTNQRNTNQKEVIHYTAIGDSLTEGIGDATNSGGFVPLVAKDLEEKYQLNGIEISNFGKNGDRSDQILARIKKDKNIQKNIASADIITLTVGGNDLMYVIKGDIFNLTKESFEKPLKKYQKTIQKLFNEVRNYNSKAPIYVVGIYNPYYLYFPDITEIQEVVDDWNNGTQEMVQKQQNLYFVPINEVMSKGSSNTMNTSEIPSNSNKNDLLYENDVFHPNNLGYQLMAKEVKDKIIETSNKWLKKENK